MKNNRQLTLDFPSQPLVPSRDENGIDYHYGQLIELSLSKPQTYNTGVGNRYVSNWTYRVPGEDWNRPIELCVGDLGYKGDRAKMQQLCRNYYTPEVVAEAQAKMKARFDRKMDLSSVGIHNIDIDLDMELAMDLGDVDSDPRVISVGFSTGGPSKKRKQSMGPCIVGLTATHIKQTRTQPHHMSVSIFYRSTEITQKFGADLLFLKNIIIPAMIPPEMLPVTEINFHFTQTYFSPAFVPVLLKYKSPIELLKWLKGLLHDPQNKGDLNLFKSCVRIMCMPLNFKDLAEHKFRTRRVMHELLINNLGADYDYTEMAEYIKSIGYEKIIREKLTEGIDED